MPRRPSHGRRVIAYHEAGHAAVARALGLRVELVQIVPHATRYDTRGQCFNEQPANRKDRIAVLLGGPIAVWLAGFDALPLADGDFHAVEELLCRVPAGQLAPTIARQVARTAELVQRHWFETCAIAAHLQRYAVADERTLDQIFAIFTTPAAARPRLPEGF